MKLLYCLITSLYLIHDISCAAVGAPLSAEEGRDIDSCISACKTFRESFYNFAKELNDEHWAAAKRDFSTCQYRCYKCTMKDGIAAMDAIDKFTSNWDGQATHLYILTYQQLNLVKSVEVCREKWKISAALNCQKSPMEDAVDLQEKKCIA